eukprot:jgi/Mesen1/6297/ME000325S05445
MNVSSPKNMLAVLAPVAPLMPSMSTAQQLLDDSKKIRKPYTITKSRENWTEQEHDKFLEALQLFDRDWKKIEAFIGTKTVIQIRSHAQKYFLKVQKNGTGEHVPPPRPKRKSAQPYPQKATSKTGEGIAPALLPPPPLPKGGYAAPSPSDTAPTLQLPSSAPAVAGNGPPASVSGWVHHSVHPPGPLYAASKAGADLLEGLPSDVRSGDASNPAPWAQRMGQMAVLKPEPTSTRATPDFAKVYHYIGSVFDPNGSGHLRRLKDMATLDKETVLLLMRNLSINLASPDFEEHRLFLSVYDGSNMEGEEGNGGGGTGTGTGAGAGTLSQAMPPPPLPLAVSRSCY